MTKRNKLLMALEAYGDGEPSDNQDSTQVVSSYEQDAPPSEANVANSSVAVENDKPLPVNDTDPILNKNQDDPTSDGKVVDINVVEKGKETESGITTGQVEEFEIAQEEDLAVIERANETLAELDKYRPIVEQASGENSLTGVGAELLNTALESIYARAGLATIGRSVPSLESFDTAGGRARGAKIALEDLDSKAAKIKEFIINMFKKMIQKGKEFLQKLLANRKAVSEQVDKAAQEVKAAPDVQVPKNKVLENPSFYARFNIEGKEVNLSQAINEAVEAVKYYTSNVIIKNTNILANKFDEILTSNNIDPDSFEAWVDKYMADLSKEYSHLSKKVILGNFGFQEVNFETKSIATARIDFASKKERQNSGNLRVLNKQEYSALLEQAKSLDELIDSVNKTKIMTIQRENELISKINGVNKKNYFGTALNDIVWQFAYINQNLARMVTYLLNLQSGAGLYVSASVRATVD